MIRGWAVDLDPDRAELVLAHLDDVEGTASDLFRRVRITLLAGEVAWAYECGAVAPSWSPTGAWAEDKGR